MTLSDFRCEMGLGASPLPPLSVTLLEKLLELVFEVVGGDSPVGGVGDGLFAEVVEGEGTGRGEAAAPGLIQDEPHQLQRYFRVRLALLQVSPLERTGLVLKALPVDGTGSIQGPRGPGRRYGKLGCTLVLKTALLHSTYYVAGVVRG